MQGYKTFLEFCTKRPQIIIFLDYSSISDSIALFYLYKSSKIPANRELF